MWRYAKKDVLDEVVIQLIECNKHLNTIVNTLDFKKSGVNKTKKTNCDAHSENLETDGEIDAYSDKSSIHFQEEPDASAIIKVKKVFDCWMWVCGKKIQQQHETSLCDLSSWNKLSRITFLCKRYGVWRNWIAKYWLAKLER